LMCAKAPPFCLSQIQILGGVYEGVSVMASVPAGLTYLTSVFSVSPACVPKRDCVQTGSYPQRRLVLRLA
jgi:hypothetical protein